MLPSSGSCKVHPDRPGVGVCVECRRVVCTECTTRFEGINRCAGCLARRQEAARQEVVKPEWSVGTVLLSLSGVPIFLFVVLAIVLAFGTD